MQDRAPRPAEPYATSLRRDPGRLRIAVTADNPLGMDVDEDSIHGLRIAAELLETGLDPEEIRSSCAAADLERRSSFF